jgi:hypothetical protein
VQSSAGGRKEGRKEVCFGEECFLFGFYMSGKGKEGAWMEAL